MDKKLIFTVLIIILGGFIFWGSQSGFFAGLFVPPVPPTPLPSGIVLFFGADCPHCQDLEAFITANNIDQKIKFTKLEIPFNGKTSTGLVANSELLVQIAQKCNINANQVGIPFLYDGNGKCYIGEPDVPNFFKNAAGIK